MLYSLGWASSDEEFGQSPFHNSRGREWSVRYYGLKLFTANFVSNTKSF